MNLAPSHDSKQTVLVATIGVGVFSAIGYVHKHQSPPPARLIAGTFVMGSLLSLLAEFAPKTAAAFAGIALVTAVFVVGGDAWSGITSSLGQPTSNLPLQVTPTIRLT